MVTVNLYIVRHGLAGEQGSYANDDERPLTEAGMRKTRQVAKRLKSLELQFDLILTSPLVRAKQTAEILQAVGLSDRLEESPLLAPGGDFDGWLAWLQTWRQNFRSSDQPGLAIVGHEPGLSEWTERLVWGGVKHRVIVKKAGVVGITLPESGSPVGQSELFWLAPPRLLL